MKNICYLLSTLIFLTISSKLSAQLASLNQPYDIVQFGIDKENESLELLYNKRKGSKIKFEYTKTLGEINDVNGTRNKYISLHYIIYKTPHFNFSNSYYFNEKGICDSIIVIENVCLDCERKETDNILCLFQKNWVKLSLNEYESFFWENNFTLKRVVPKFRKSKTNKIYVRLIADQVPATGECKKWTLTLKEGLVYPGIKLPKRI